MRGERVAESSGGIVSMQNATFRCRAAVDGVYKLVDSGRLAARLQFTKGPTGIADVVPAKGLISYIADGANDAPSTMEQELKITHEVGMPDMVDDC